MLKMSLICNSYTGKTFLTGNGARPDIRARNIWWNGQKAFFDIRVTNTNANTQNHVSPAKLERHEKEKNASAIIVLWT